MLVMTEPVQHAGSLVKSVQETQLLRDITSPKGLYSLVKKKHW